MVVVWQDVVYDTASSQAYASALRMHASRLESVAAELDEQSADARRDWFGDARDTFDADVDRLWEDLLQNAADLRDAADEVEEELLAAQTEQQGRERERARLRERMEAVQ